MKNFSNYDVNGVEYKKQKQNKLNGILTDKWLSDSWDMHQIFPTFTRSNKSIEPLTFTKNLFINLEIKYAAYKVLSTRTWSKDAILNFFRGMRVLIAYLNSLNLDSSPSLIMMDYRRVLDGLDKYRNENAIAKTTFKYSITLLNKLIIELIIIYDDRDEYSKDIWFVDRIGIPNSPIKPIKKFNFQGIYPDWLKRSIKWYFKQNIHLLSASTIQSNLSALKNISTYLKDNYPYIKSTELNRKIILELITELKKKYTDHSLHSIVSTYKVFLDFCYFNDRSNYPKMILLKEDVPEKPKSLSRSIPYYVLEQLEKNLDELPRDIYIMLKIELETGIRYSELLTLKTSCIIVDDEGDSFLRNYQLKTKKENIIPITKEIATLINEQREYVNKNWGKSMQYLFPSSKGKPFSPVVISKKIKDFIIECGIKTEEGDNYNFKMHEIRHTVGTRMINNGVPMHFVQKYLGQQSPEVTSIYAKIHDSTLKNEILPKTKMFVDINGSIDVEENVKSNLSTDLYNQILPNGYCALPIDISCPHSNACLTCTHFRTDQSFLNIHLEQIEKTRELIALSKQKSLERQVQTNTDILNKLTNIVSSLTKLEEN